MRRLRQRWRIGVVVVGMLGLVASVGLPAAFLLIGDLSTAANVAQLISVVMALLSLVFGLVVWWRRSVKPVLVEIRLPVLVWAFTRRAGSR